MVRRYILSNLLAGQDPGQFTDGANRRTKDTISKGPVTSGAAGELLQLGDQCHHPQTGDQTNFSTGASASVCTSARS